jgi:hypothetical protein
MKHLFNDINKDEKDRILEMHKVAINCEMINEIGSSLLRRKRMQNKPDWTGSRRVVDPSKVLGYLVGKRFRLTAKDSKSSIDVQIEAVEDRGADSGVHLDGNLINKSGESIGGIFGTGKLNNLDISCDCETRGFWVGAELIGAENRAAGAKYYYNDQLQSEIKNKYCKVLIQKGFKPR